MGIPDKALVKKRFSRRLNTYSGAAGIQRFMAEKLTAMIFSRQREFRRILEIGAGTGILSGLLDDRLVWEERMVNDLADDCAPFHANRRNTIFLSGDAETADWGDEPFDLICSNAAFQWLADLPAFLEKLRKSLNPGGLLAFTTFGPDNLKELTFLTGNSLSYYPAGQISGWLENSGFAVQEAFAENHVRLFDDPLDILKQMRQTGVTASSDKSWWTPRRLAVFRKNYRKCFGTPGGKVRLNWNPVYILARKA